MLPSSVRRVSQALPSAGGDVDTYTEGSFLPPMAFQSSVETASRKSTKYPVVGKGRILNKRYVNGVKQACASPWEHSHTHLPHEHEEEAGSGHESSPAGRRQHPKHGHNYRGKQRAGQGQDRVSIWSGVSDGQTHRILGKGG